MDEMTRLRDLWAETSEPTPEGLAPARRRLLAELRSRDRARPVRRTWLPPIRVGRAVPAAALAVALVGTAVTVEVAQHHRAAPVRQTAYLVLERAANAAAAETWADLAPGQYVRRVTRIRVNNLTSGPGDESKYTVTPQGPYDQTTYFGADDANGIFALPKVPGGLDWMCTGKTLRTCTDVGAVPDAPVTDAAMSAMSRWPTDPAALRGFLLAHVTKQFAGGLAAGRSRSAIWDVIADLLVWRPVPPGQLAAMYRILQTVPGVTLVRNAVDAAGRHGVGVARDVEGVTGPAVSRDEFIFSVGNYQYLGYLNQNVRAAGLPPGLLLRSVAQLQTTVVDHGPQVLTRRCRPMSCPPRSGFMTGS